MVKAIIDINDEGNRILNIVKAKENFKDKNETLNFVLNQYGKELLEPELRPEFVKEVLDSRNQETVKVDDWDQHYGLD